MYGHGKVWVNFSRRQLSREITMSHRCIPPLYVVAPEYIIVKVECDIRQILTVKAYKDGRGVKEYTCYVDSSHPCHYSLQEK